MRSKECFNLKAQKFWIPHLIFRLRGKLTVNLVYGILLMAKAYRGRELACYDGRCYAENKVNNRAYGVINVRVTFLSLAKLQ